jgi:hypothetical protein
MRKILFTLSVLLVGTVAMTLSGQSLANSLVAPADVAPVVSSDASTPSNDHANALREKLTKHKGKHDKNNHHQNTGVSGTTEHPVHGKIYGHRNVHHCIAHCTHHHAELMKKHQDNNLHTEALSDCKAACHSHHKSAQAPDALRGVGVKPVGVKPPRVG